MKIVVYGPDQRTGAYNDGKIVDLSYAYAKYLKETKGQANAVDVAEALVPSDLRRLIEGGGGALENAKAAVDYVLQKARDQKDPRGASLVFDASQVQIHPPRPRGARVACAGSNFQTHRERMTVRSGREVAAPFIWGFWKVSEPIGPDGEMTYPARCDRLDYEGELAIVIGRSGKDLKPADLKDCVWGYTLFCDWSIRSPREPLGPMNFAIGKNFDTSYSLGPWIAAGEGDCTNIDIETYVNGERRQKHNTSEMTFSFGQYLEYLSRDFTLRPGDLVASGTGAGTAADASPVGQGGVQPPDLFVKAGDAVEIRSPQVGSLRAKIVPKAGAR